MLVLNSAPALLWNSGSDRSQVTAEKRELELKGGGEGWDRFNLPKRACLKRKEEKKKGEEELKQKEKKEKRGVCGDSSIPLFPFPQANPPPFSSALFK